jgi:hypothetical protein
MSSQNVSDDELKINMAIPDDGNCPVSKTLCFKQ